MKAPNYLDDELITANKEERRKASVYNKRNKLSRGFYYLSYGIGACAIVFAGLSLATNMNLVDILLWISKYFGLSFTVLYGLLLACGAWSIIRLHALSDDEFASGSLPSSTSSTSTNENNKLLAQRIFWHQVGMQTANGISTLALTFTLLGISLGIGSLSEQSLSPDNVNNVISILTTQFSMAFMTTVVGLPSATGLRAYIGILFAKQDIQSNSADTEQKVSINHLVSSKHLEEQS